MAKNKKATPPTLEANGEVGPAGYVLESGEIIECDVLSMTNEKEVKDGFSYHTNRATLARADDPGRRPYQVDVSYSPTKEPGTWHWL